MLKPGDVKSTKEHKIHKRGVIKIRRCDIMLANSTSCIILSFVCIIFFFFFFFTAKTGALKIYTGNEKKKKTHLTKVKTEFYITFKYEILKRWTCFVRMRRQKGYILYLSTPKFVSIWKCKYIVPIDKLYFNVNEPNFLTFGQA